MILQSLFIVTNLGIITIMRNPAFLPMCHNRDKTLTRGKNLRQHGKNNYSVVLRNTTFSFSLFQDEGVS